MIEQHNVKIVLSSAIQGTKNTKPNQRTNGAPANTLSFEDSLNSAEK
jgi:hypothetical protein